MGSLRQHDFSMADVTRSLDGLGACRSHNGVHGRLMRVVARGGTAKIVDAVIELAGIICRIVYLTCVSQSVVVISGSAREPAMRTVQKLLGYRISCKRGYGVCPIIADRQVEGRIIIIGRYAVARHIHRILCRRVLVAVIAKRCSGLVCGARDKVDIRSRVLRRHIMAARTGNAVKYPLWSGIVNLGGYS